MAGHMFETFVVSEVLKSYTNAGGTFASVSFYRDARKREIVSCHSGWTCVHRSRLRQAPRSGPDALRNFSAIGGNHWIRGRCGWSSARQTLLHHARVTSVPSSVGD